jgi:hypothetical protein
MPHTHADKTKKAAAAAKADAPSNAAKEVAKAAAAGGVAAQEQALAPKAEVKAPEKAKAAAKAVALPESTYELLDHPEIAVTPAANFKGDLPAEIAQLLIAGVTAGGIYDGEMTASAILKNYIDGGRVEALKVAAGGASYLWLRHYSGDTEVGYLFQGTKLAGIVNDGEITRL